MRLLYLIIFAFFLMSSSGCMNNSLRFKNNESFKVETVTDNFQNLYELAQYINHVTGHEECDSIVGNFTGYGLDTIFVVSREIETVDKLGFTIKYFAVSNNPQIPEIEIFGCLTSQPQIVYEGDVDGDGRDEWGYMHTWHSSQWRQYRIYNYDPENKKWRFLYYDNKASQFLDTSESLRNSGIDIVEKGPRPGLIKINYMTDEVAPELRDTIIAPTYTSIDKDHW